MPLERGTLLNKRYRIVEILGQGGMGSVYRAVDENLGVDLAVKENLFTSEEYSRQFRREATILASLRHPNLPRVTDHFEIENRGQYLIMDYIEGEDLRERMDRDGRLGDGEAIVIGIAICDALTYLHSRKPQVVHRDIKPGNVKITPDGRIFLVDFGLAKVVQGSQATTTGARAMTPGYSPPEQYGTARTDHRSDIYSLGATLYAALCGTLPEDGLARAMEQAELTSVRRQNPKVSRRLASTIEKALAVQPDARYQSAEEFKLGLLAAATPTVRRASGELTVSPPPVIEDDEIDEDVISPNGSGRRASEPAAQADEDSQSSLRPVNKPLEPISASRNRSQPARRNSFGCFVYLFVLLILFTGGGALAYSALPDFRDQVNILITPFLPAQIAGAAFTPTEQNNASVAQTPNPGTPTATLSPTPTRTATESPSQTSEPTETITPTPTVTSIFTVEPAFLGNSNGEVAFVSDRTGLPQIWMINVDGVRFRQITDMPDGACQPDWSPDGQRLVFVSPCPDRREMYLGAQLYSIRPDTTGFTVLLGSAAGDYDPAWSPDGSKIVFTSLRGTGRPQIYVLNLDDGDIRPLATDGAKNMQATWSPDGNQIIYVSTSEMGERLWIMDDDGSNKRPLTDALYISGYPDWSIDTQTVVFTRRESIGMLPNLQWALLDDFAPSFFVEDSVPRRDADISPDGLWMVYESWPEGSDHDIWIMSMDGEETRVLVDFPFYDFNPVWRPFVEIP
jgi:eukaryotic-like serine/threonine-protein kinase